VAQAPGPLTRAENVAKADSSARSEGIVRAEPQPRVQPAAVAAPVHVQPQEAPFIPPHRASGQAQAEVTAPDPFREAEIVNAPSQEREGRRPGLFERIARTTARGRSAGEASLPSRAEPRMARAVTAQNQAPTAPTLSGFEAPERPSTPQREEDLLDIPAFLRRQAN
jgi:cell division protein FtsZ